MSKTITSIVNPTIDTGAYAVGDCVGGLLLFEKAARIERSSFLFNLRLISKINVQAAFDLFLFSEPPTGVFTDQSPVVFGANDNNILIDSLTIATTDYKLNIGTSYIARPSIGDPIPLNLRDSILYGVLKATGTPTFTNTLALIIRLGIQLN